MNKTDSSYLLTVSTHDISLDSSLYSSPRAPEFETSMDRSEVDHSTDAESVSSVMSDENTVTSATTHGM